MKRKLIIIIILLVVLSICAYFERLDVFFVVMITLFLLDLFPFGDLLRRTPKELNVIIYTEIVDGNIEVSLNNSADKDNMNSHLLWEDDVTKGIYEFTVNVKQFISGFEMSYIFIKAMQDSEAAWNMEIWNYKKNTLEVVVSKDLKFGFAWK